MKKNKTNITKILLNNNRVNNYTKLLIKLQQLDYFEDYYIPNAKLMKMLGIHKKNLIVLLKQLKEDRIIAIFYKGRKKYFTFIADTEDKEAEFIEEKSELYDYDWLEEDGVLKNDR